MINILRKHALTYYNEVGLGSKKPHHPSLSSGVTIGCGYDLKHKTNGQILIELEASKIGDDYIEAISKGRGLDGLEAREFCIRNSHLELTENQQISLFITILPKYETKAIKDYNEMFKGDNPPNYLDLPSEYRDLLFDFTYNLGSIKSFPKFFRALLSGDRKGAYANYKRFTGGKPLGRRNDDTREVLDGIVFKNYLK